MLLSAEVSGTCSGDLVRRGWGYVNTAPRRLHCFAVPAQTFCLVVAGDTRGTAWLLVKAAWTLGGAALGISPNWTDSSRIAEQ